MLRGVLATGLATIQCLRRQRRAKRKFSHRIVAIDRGEARARVFAVLLHLRDKRLLIFESAIGSQELDELDLHLLVVKVSGKIQEKCLQDRLAFAESGARPHIAGRIVPPAVCMNAHGVDAVTHILPGLDVIYQVEGASTHDDMTRSPHLESIAAVIAHHVDGEPPPENLRRNGPIVEITASIPASASAASEA